MTVTFIIPFLGIKAKFSFYITFKSILLGIQRGF